MVTEAVPFVDPEPPSMILLPISRKSGSDAGMFVVEDDPLTVQE